MGEEEKKEEKKAEAPQTPPTALALLLGSAEQPNTEEVIKALTSGSGFVISISEVRRYLQASGKKVKKVADGILTIGVNVAFMKALHQAVKGTGATIGLGDALTVVKEAYGVEIPPEVIRFLELASG